MSRPTPGARSDQHVGIRCPRRQVRRDVQCRGLRHHAEALARHADEAGHGPPAVRGDQVLAGHDVAAPGGVVPDRRADAVAVLVEAGELVAEPDRRRRQLLGPVLEQGLEPELRKAQLPTRAGRAPVLIGAAGCRMRASWRAPAPRRSAACWPLPPGALRRPADSAPFGDGDSRGQV
jgi:hypothetical protein